MVEDAQSTTYGQVGGPESIGSSGAFLEGFQKRKLVVEDHHAELQGGELDPNKLGGF